MNFFFLLFNSFFPLNSIEQSGICSFRYITTFNIDCPLFVGFFIYGPNVPSSITPQHVLIQTILLLLSPLKCTFLLSGVFNQHDTNSPCNCVGDKLRFFYSPSLAIVRQNVRRCEKILQFTLTSDNFVTFDKSGLKLGLFFFIGVKKYRELCALNALKFVAINNGREVGKTFFNLSNARAISF